MQAYPKRYEIRLDNRTYERLQNASKLTGLPLSHLIRDYIKTGLDDSEKG